MSDAFKPSDQKSRWTKIREHFDEWLKFYTFGCLLLGMIFLVQIVASTRVQGNVPIIIAFMIIGGGCRMLTDRPAVTWLTDIEEFTLLQRQIYRLVINWILLISLFFFYVIAIPSHLTRVLTGSAIFCLIKLFCNAYDYRKRRDLKVWY